MSRYIADLHVHSRFALACSRSLAAETIDGWARLKGVRVVCTGDITHPEWRRELAGGLEPAEEGLFRLKGGMRREGAAADFPWAAERAVSFVLGGEISTIFRRDGRLRRVHQLLLLRGWEEADALCRRLAERGANLESDGRPILGMDSRDLLELALDATGGTVLFVPAHIWTPWFSVLGEGSGFSTIEECFGDLSVHIHALETGLSSDPSMNGLCPFLDRFTLVSGSDAHSAEKIGREATVLDGEPSFAGIAGALRDGGAVGTIEFFPEEGKYHYDGHRRCGVRLHPAETMRRQGLCPRCGKPLTVGVLNRVLRLAGRSDGAGRPNRPAFHSLVALRVILAEVLEASPGSRRVEGACRSLLSRLGPELEILIDAPAESIGRAAGEEVAEAVRRMRARQVVVEVGYDGEYGRIRLFSPGERGGGSGSKQRRRLVTGPAPRAADPGRRPVRRVDGQPGEGAE